MIFKQKHVILFLIILLVFPFFSQMVIAVDLEPVPDPGDVEEEEFIPYAYATPESFDPIWHEQTSLEWNFELDHPNSTIDVRKDGEVVGVIEDNIGYDSGEHSYSWHGKIDGNPLEPGDYIVVITPHEIGRAHV